jgi:hypothetical protein
VTLPTMLDELPHDDRLGVISVLWTLGDDLTAHEWSWRLEVPEIEVRAILRRAALAKASYAAGRP